MRWERWRHSESGCSSWRLHTAGVRSAATREAEAATSAFVDDLTHHDLRNGMTVICGDAEMVAGDAGADDRPDPGP